MLDQLMKNLDYVFRDQSLLVRALRHPSMGAENNQRMEFLGDAVLQFLMSEQLYTMYPQLREGGLTHQRALLVCEAALSQVARRIDLGRCLRMDKGEAYTHGREKPSILADAMEADLPYKIDCPAILICGTRDEAGSAKNYNKRWAKHESLPIYWIRGAGHNANTDRPELVNNIIHDFLESL